MGGFLKTTLCASAGVSGIGVPSGRTAGTGTFSDERRRAPPVPRPCPGRGQESRGRGGEWGRGGTEEQHGDQQHHKPEVQSDGPQVQGRDDLPDRLERRIGGRVDDLEPRGDDAGGAPVARQHHHPVDDEPREEQDEEDEQNRRDDLPEESHGPRSFRALRVPLPQSRECPSRVPQDWLKNPPSRIRALSSAVTSTFCGLSRKTFAVTRSILPRSPKDRPAAKSTRRLASESSISERFMMTGIPSRKRSPMVRASLYVRGCSVVIR